jgi:hypothetical protein
MVLEVAEVVAVVGVVVVVDDGATVLVAHLVMSW